MFVFHEADPFGDNVVAFSIGDTGYRGLVVIVLFKSFWWGMVIAGFFELLAELLFELINTSHIFVSLFKDFGFSVADGGNESPHDGLEHIIV